MQWKVEDTAGLRSALRHAVQRLEWQSPSFITSEVTALVRLALEFRGFDVRAEVGIRYAGGHGRIDLGAYEGDRRLAIAVEIDRSDKPRSLSKLQAAGLGKLRTSRL